MKNITTLVNKYKAEYARKYCELNDISQCKKSPCSCKLAAEISAYIEGIIPSEFQSCSLQDFNGVTKGGDVVLSKQESKNIKDKISKLCWNKTTEEIVNLKPRELDSYCVLGERRENGENIIICGESKEKIGRSMIAALIMKMAIRQRVYPVRYLESYEWVEYTLLKNLLTNKENIQESFEYKVADWLVIDNIDKRYYGTAAQEAYIKDSIEPFFYSRLKDNCSTILVFKQNIFCDTYKEDFEKIFGNAMKQIVFSDKSHRICIENKK